MSDAPVVLRPVGTVAELANAVVAECRAVLGRLVPGAHIEHVGATALSSGVTKGDVDVNVRVPADQFAEAVELLERNFAIAQPQNCGDVCEFLR